MMLVMVSVAAISKTFGLLLFFLILRLLAKSPLFPYTTLFRSGYGFPDRRGRARCAASRSRGSGGARAVLVQSDRKSTRLNSSHGYNSYAVFCLKKKTWMPDRTEANPN